MISVARPPAPVEVREALTKPGRSDKKTELEKAREYYSQTPPPKKSYSFARYKEWAVCRALDDLFYEKCAYCETTYRATDSRDVEHFRPKAGVTESPGHKGYWWLAAVWQNLLPSCPPCNQRRHQTIFDPGMSLEQFERDRLKESERLSGKANSFPVLGKNWVMDETDDITVEDPLLINPCERDPANHLEFIFEWDRKSYIWEADPINALVRPKQAANDDDPYAKASIAIYGLNRAGLVRERAERVKVLQLQCQPIVDLINDLAGSPSPSDLARIQARLKNYRANLLSLTKPNQPYAAMARAFVAQFEAELERLKNDLA
ncbi:MAG TPA: hypothetical protein VJT09_12285 [Pyrinomonadaceae bacterium]|nr:hypothetical protein [Pyrinomonadaceae bacterium]